MITFLSLPPDTINLESWDIFKDMISSECPTNVWIGSVIALLRRLLRLYNLILLSKVLATAENVPHWLIVTAVVDCELVLVIFTSD